MAGIVRYMHCGQVVVRHDLEPHVFTTAAWLETFGVGVLGRHTIETAPGRTVKLRGFAVDPDRGRLTFLWWQYGEEGTYPGNVTISSPNRPWTTVTVPADAQRGQTISLILQATDDGRFPLTRYTRVTVRVR